MIKGLNHITLICKDLDKTGKFLRTIFGAVEYYATQKNVYSISPEKFFKVGDLWLVIMSGRSITKTYNHIAFQVDYGKFAWFKRELKKLGLTVLKGRSRKKSEGKSIYFYDYDNHLFELHSGDLAQRLAYYRKHDRL